MITKMKLGIVFCYLDTRFQGFLREALFTFGTPQAKLGNRVSVTLDYNHFLRVTITLYTDSL